jgi:hypothetical protein
MFTFIIFIYFCRKFYIELITVYTHEKSFSFFPQPLSPEINITPEELRKKKEIAAERAANELLKIEEREKESKKAFSNSSMKKGFLERKMKK